MEQYKYFAFISYNSKDIAWGKRIQKKLENYRRPSTLCSEHGWERKPIKPVFFAPTDIQPGGLTAELQERLKSSRNLIVICSPNSAKSEWVGREIEYFHSLGRADNIHFFIVDGVPHSGNEETECFNPVIETLGLPEILGANIHEKVSRWPWINRERAYVQLITKLLGVEFDSIWQRHKRMLAEKCAAWVIGVCAVISVVLGVWINNQPVDVNIRLNEVSVHNDKLPDVKDAVVSVILENETKTDTIPSMDAAALFANIPHKAIGKNVHVRVECKNWLTTDTTFVLSKDITLNIARDNEVFGYVCFTLYDSKTQPMPNTRVFLDDMEGTTDTNGWVEYNVPIEKQKTIYRVSSVIPLQDTLINTPCSKAAAIFAQ